MSTTTFDPSLTPDHPDNLAPQHLFFRSEQVTAHWDTWMAFRNNIYYMFYLITESSPGEGFGLATSTDGEPGMTMVGLYGRRRDGDLLGNGSRLGCRGQHEK